MLKRFMSWLLHRLQKLLSPLGSERRHSHSPAPAQNAGELEQSEAYIAPLESYPEQESEPSALDSSTLLSPQTATGSEYAHSVESDIYVSANATAVAQGILANPNASTAASELIASGALNYLLEAPDTDDLPEIHDLLPAIEPEASVESVERATALPKKEPEASPEETIEAAVDFPAQAVLFSFDIVESEAAPVEAAVPEPSLSEEPAGQETPLETFYADDFAAAPPAEAIADDDDKSKGSSDAENPYGVEDTESPENFEGARLAAEGAAAESVPEGRKTGQIEIVIEIADESVEPILVSAEQSPEAHSSEAESSAENSTENPGEAIDASSSEKPVKQGVVKLLFTVKQGNFHGYIEPDDGTKDILFHQKYINADIFDRLERGTKVVAVVKYIEGKAYAARVDLL